jgi:DNA (cytosine-5)-methyltransferase 1
MSRALGQELQTEMFCEWWTPARAVLQARFPGVDVHPDVRTLESLPAEVNLVSAGFPCTDLSQAGRMQGIDGVNSGLVRHLFDALRAAGRVGTMPTLIIENVPNMLSLDRGKAMHYLVTELESLGYRWAYRVVDSRFSGVPQRRRRVLLVASVDLDPRQVLFADNAPGLSETGLSDEAFGFYWTEGRGGLGWAQDAVPTIKGGSTIGIPSPPAIWLPGGEPGRKFVKPSIEDAEAMQGFPRGWTAVENVDVTKKGPRWKMVGNAVTVGVAEWLGSRLLAPGAVHDDVQFEVLGSGRWPMAAWGETDKVYSVTGISEYPQQGDYTHLADVVDLKNADVLSHRGALGFQRRLKLGNLGKHPGFRDSVEEHVELMASA